jgi:hypothetical protein
MQAVASLYMYAQDSTIYLLCTTAVYAQAVGCTSLYAFVGIVHMKRELCVAST